MTFRNNLFVIRNRFLKAGGEVGILTIEHNTVDNGGPLGALYFGAVHRPGESQREATAAIQNLTFRNNLLYLNEGLSGDGTAPGMSTLQTYATTSTWSITYWPTGSGHRHIRTPTGIRRAPSTRHSSKAITRLLLAAHTGTLAVTDRISDA